VATMPPPVRRLGVVEVNVEHSGEGPGTGVPGQFSRKGYPHLFLSEDDRRCLQGGDARQRLGVEQQQSASDAVGK
jgi:hypothetical protein